LKSGVILAFASGTRSQELFEMANERYNILCKGKVIHHNLTEEQYLDTMEDLAQQFYQTGAPSSGDLKTEIYVEESEWQQKQKVV